MLKFKPFKAHSSLKIQSHFLNLTLYYIKFRDEKRKKWPRKLILTRHIQLNWILIIFERWINNVKILNLLNWDAIFFHIYVLLIYYELCTSWVCKIVRCYIKKSLTLVLLCPEVEEYQLTPLKCKNSKYTFWIKKNHGRILV